MLVIGVAEPENPAPAPEAESEMRHDEYEDNVGLAIAGVASRCVENVAVFGLNGLRERVLVSYGPFVCTFTATVLMPSSRYTSATPISPFGTCISRQKGTFLFREMSSQEQ